MSIRIPNLGVLCQKWSNWTSRVEVRQKNPTLTPSVVRNLTPTQPRNFRLLTTSTPAPQLWISECIISDRAVAVFIQCSLLPEFDDEEIKPQPCWIDWFKVTAQEREGYYHEIKNLVDQLLTHGGYTLSKF